jgi:hypothetical protein
MLLRSIRQRKEELKALEGRKKALEALKKIAFEAQEKQANSSNVKKANVKSNFKQVYNDKDENNLFATKSNEPKLVSELNDNNAMVS